MVSVVVIVLMAGFGTRVKQKRTPKVVRSFGVRVDENAVMFRLRSQRAQVVLSHWQRLPEVTALV